MDYATGVLLGVIAIIAVNQLVMRVGALKARPAVFWSLQAMNLAVLTWVLVMGLPGFERWPVVSWIIGLLLMFRTIQNNGVRARWLRAQKVAGEQEERAEQVRAALRASRVEE